MSAPQPARDATAERPAATPAAFGDRIADPGPLGLAAFAGTTFFLSVVNSGMLGDTVETIVLGLALFYGGLAQFLAGMWEFTKGNTFGALAFTSFGAFWMSFWYLLNHLPADAAESDLYHGVAVYLLMWTIFTAYMTVAASRTTGAIFAVFVLLTLTFLALAIGWFADHSETWIKIGGWLGILTALAAWYASFAGVVNSTFRRVVFPVFPR